MINNNQRSADRRKYHVIYKTTCLITGRYYIGMHSTDNLNDGYLGSGKRLWYSINKHSKENHIYEILEHLPSREALRLREAELVTHELLDDKQCMNIALGGAGSWDHCNKKLKLTSPGHYRKAGYRGYLESLKQGKRVDFRTVNRAAIIKTQRELKCGFFNPLLQARGRTFANTAEAKAKRRQTFAEIKHQAGEANSNFGYRWVNKNNEAKRILVSSLQEHLAEGWAQGRTPPKVKPEKVKRESQALKFWQAWIEEQAEQLLTEFDSHKSISKLLLARGITSKAGNGYISDWLKSNNRQPLTRRNSS